MLTMYYLVKKNQPMHDNQLYYVQNKFVCLKKNKIPIYTSFKYKIKNMYMLKKYVYVKKKIQLTQLENMLVTLGRDIMSLPWENIFEF